MTALADLRVLLALPLLGALVVMFAPARWSRGLGGSAAGLALVIATFIALAEPTSLAVQVGWVDALGLAASLGVGGSTVPGLLVTCLIGQVAALAPGGSRGSIAGGLVLQGAVLAALLARDLGFLIACHALLAPIVVVLLAGSPRPDRLRAALGAGFYLALGTAALALAGGLLAVAQHDASGGQWSLELAALAENLLPARMEAAVAVALVLAGTVTLGVWPLHGWLLAATASARPGTALLLVGPVRWLGVDLLLRLWLPLAPTSAALHAPVLAWIAVIGALYGAVLARAEPDRRRAIGLASLVPAGLIVLGLAGQHHEGLLAAVMLALALTLGGAAAVYAHDHGAGHALLHRLAPLGLLPAPGLIGLAGVALVVLGTARFAGLTLGGHAIWLALVAMAAALLSLRALSNWTGPKGHGETDRPGRGAALGFAVLLAPLVITGVSPARTLGASHTAARAWVEATARHRCERAVRTIDAPTRAPAEPSEACAQPLRALERLQGGGR